MVELLSGNKLKAFAEQHGQRMGCSKNSLCWQSSCSRHTAPARHVQCRVPCDWYPTDAVGAAAVIVIVIVGLSAAEAASAAASAAAAGAEATKGMPPTAGEWTGSTGVSQLGSPGLPQP